MHFLESNHRIIVFRYYEIFFCTKGESCEINLTTRKSCQFCRFKKCLESGMRIAWVLPDGERHRKVSNGFFIIMIRTFCFKVK